MIEELSQTVTDIRKAVSLVDSVLEDLESFLATSRRLPSTGESTPRSLEQAMDRVRASRDALAQGAGHEKHDTSAQGRFV